tara:strand:- start:4408 stop:5202 length:795 start_codon:yes stop_codon:yes gene_type:complete
MKKYLVLGNPIDHSLSPKLHNYWFSNYNVDATYDKIKLEKDQIEKLIQDIKEKKINGINVTVPYKKTIIPFLDTLSIESKKTESVNTVYLDDNKVIGHNTDIFGFEQSIKNINFDLKNKKILILGSGGVVSSLIFCLYKMNVAEIIVTNRTKNKADQLKEIFNDLTIVEWGEVPHFDMIINATSLGLNTEDDLNLDLSKVGKNKLFYDVIYNPIQTNFLKLGQELGNLTINGKMMFIYQAAAAFKIWHGIYPTIDKNLINLLNK